MKISDKTYVAIEYALSLDDGTEVDRSQEGIPLSFITGAGQIISGLEKHLQGMTVGEKAKISIDPKDGYGEINDELIQEIARDRFPKDEDIKPGMSFEAEGPRGPFMIVVKSVNDNDTVTIDLNHPMAGKRLHFNIKVVEVREPSDEEISKIANNGCGCGCGQEENSECNSSGCSC